MMGASEISTPRELKFCRSIEPSQPTPSVGNGHMVNSAPSETSQARLSWRQRAGPLGGDNPPPPTQ